MSPILQFYGLYCIFELFSKTMVIYKVDKKSWRISKVSLKNIFILKKTGKWPLAFVTAWIRLFMNINAAIQY